MPIKSFRGKLADGAIQTIALATNNGSTGYRIVKFDLFPVTPNVNQESLVSIFKVSQTAAATRAAEGPHGQIQDRHRDPFQILRYEH